MPKQDLKNKIGEMREIQLKIKVNVDHAGPLQQTLNLNMQNQSEQVKRSIFLNKSLLIVQEVKEIMDAVEDGIIGHGITLLEKVDFIYKKIINTQLSMKHVKI